MTDLAIQLPDANVLVALTNPAHQHHRQAHGWLAETDRFATTPITEAGLLRLLMNPSVTGQQVSARHALGIVSAIRDDVRAVFLPDGTSLADAAIDLIGLVGYRQVTDFHLVNLARQSGGVLVTLDRRIRAALTVADQAAVRVL